jgi:hypothetical protein
MVVHDFNKPHEKWINKFNFVYSNSWDHAYDIEETLKIWKDQIKEKGFLILETSHKHEKENSELDPYRLEKEELIDVVSEVTEFKFAKEIGTEKNGAILIWRNI